MFKKSIASTRSAMSKMSEQTLAFRETIKNFRLAFPTRTLARSRTPMCVMIFQNHF